MGEIIDLESREERASAGDSFEQPERYAALAEEFVTEMVAAAPTCMVLGYLGANGEYRIAIKTDPERGNFQAMGFCAQMNSDLKHMLLNQPSIEDEEYDA